MAHHGHSIPPRGPNAASINRLNGHGSWEHPQRRRNSPAAFAFLATMIPPAASAPLAHMATAPRIGRSRRRPAIAPPPALRHVPRSRRPLHVRDHRRPRSSASRRLNFFLIGKVPESLCANCHNSIKRRVDIDGHAHDIDHDGWPTDPRHPANKP